MGSNPTPSAMVKKAEKPFVKTKVEYIHSIEDLLSGSAEEVMTRFQILAGTKDNAEFTVNKDYYGGEVTLELKLTYTEPMNDQEIVIEKRRREKEIEQRKKTAEARKKLLAKKILQNKKDAEKQLAKLIKDNPELAKQIIEEQI